MLNANSIDLSNIGTLNINEIRLGNHIQRWQERNARAGVRYTEFLQAHFSTSPTDARLNRPEYIGGTRSSIVLSEVLQTSQTEQNGTPQANMAGHGLSAQDGAIGKYRVEEFGCIISIMSIIPKPSYSQGVNRQWLRTTRFDYPFPEFAQLQEQAILRNEIYYTPGPDGEKVFGYQGRYDELRQKPDTYSGDMRDNLDYWHLGRKFANAPELNRDFIECKPSRRIFQSQRTPGYIVNYGAIMTATRPIPVFGIPGII